MENDDEIPSGIANSPPASDLARDIEIPQPEDHREVDQTNILDQLITKKPDLKAPRTDSNFRLRTTREGSRSKDKLKNKAVSEHFDIKHNPKEEQMVLKVPTKHVKRPIETVNLPPAHPKTSSKKREEIKEVHQKCHHFNRKEYQNEQIIKDFQKHPIKYKIMCDVFGCKPEIAYEMPKEEASYIQEGYIKQKGMEYLRQGNSRARYNYIRDRRVHTESSSKLLKQNPNQKSKIKGNMSQKILKLSAKQTLEGKVVYEKVRKHIKEGEKTHNYFQHLTSEESIDQALVNFLKTKIKRAEIVLK